eukprot:GHVL01025396.1.p1 GENE.GHVL01025396.1~~GHVL01025396.1.p1  ORF type:complete len:983 (+),score=115.85 GHVL01025396.1:45-2993(+)
MPQEFENNCTLLIALDTGVDTPSSDSLRSRLESKDDEVKAIALQELILGTINGELYSNLLMTVIRFVVTSQHHRTKRLLQIYWEIVDKLKENGELKDEMILVCNALLNDLQHANEYVRGSTLRLLCKMRYFRIIEPLLEAVVKNLVHRHSYVRRNAVMCVYSILRNFGADTIPAVADDIQQLLLTENDLSTKRNAFLFLLNHSQDRAFTYAMTTVDTAAFSGDIFQMVMLDLMKRVCRRHSQHRGGCLRVIMNLVQQSTSNAVVYEGVNALVHLSSSPVTVKVAVHGYVTLLVNQPENNVKLIVLDRLADLLPTQKKILEGFVMDILRALQSPSLVVRKKTMDLALKLVTNKNVLDIMRLLKKEVLRTVECEKQTSQHQETVDYRRMLIRAVRAACRRFPEITSECVLPLILEFIVENDLATAAEISSFLRELVATCATVRSQVMKRIAEALPDIQQSRVYRYCLWIMGEFADDDVEMASVLLEAVLETLGGPPFITVSETASPRSTSAGSSSPTHTAFKKEMSHMRDLICTTGDFLLCSMVAVCLTKFCIRTFPDGNKIKNILQNRCILVVVHLLKLIRDHPDGGQKCDAAVRVMQCLRALTGAMGGQVSLLEMPQCDNDVFLEWFINPEERQILQRVISIEAEASRSTTEVEEIEEQVTVGADDLLVFRQLYERRGAGTGAELLDGEDMDLQAAAGSVAAKGGKDESTVFAERLAKVKQLTGLADAIYVEAFLQLHEFDIVVELLLINRTPNTLQNVVIELSTHGDLKLVDRPGCINLGANARAVLRATIKVASTETGVIFGYVSFDKHSTTDKQVFILNEMHIDVLDYMRQASIGEVSFRSMWSEFEWENKIIINTSIIDPILFLKKVCSCTNMTPVGRSVLNGRSSRLDSISAPDSPPCSKTESIKSETPLLTKTATAGSFFAVNLYSKSVFGEDALANVSVERGDDDRLNGSIRVRARTQGIALSLGDRISLAQRSL